MANPRISILMPLYNGEKYLRSTLDSVVAQTFKDWEIIAMDGGSKDGTLNILKEYAEKYPISVFSERDEGPWHAIYKAAQRARGELICILCASDGYVNPDWLRLCAEKLETDTGLSLVWGIPIQMNEEGAILGPNTLYAQFLEIPPAHPQLAFFANILHRFDLLHPWRSISAMIRKIHPANLATVQTILRGHVAVPQKEKWFEYWLRTGQIFPDLNMCVYRSVFLACIPEYVPGSRVPDEYMAFYYNFNARGYLAWCVPTPANYGRVHAGQFTDKVVPETERLRDEYFRKIRTLADRLKDSGRMTFIDHFGHPIADP